MNQKESILLDLAKIVTKTRIGAPNSVARYLSEHSFGNNKWIVLERTNGELVLRAAQSSFNGAYRYWMENPHKRILVDVRNGWIVYDERNADAAIEWHKTAELQEFIKLSYGENGHVVFGQK